MNILDIILPNPFLQSVFPNGLGEQILIGSLEFDTAGHIWITVHTKQQPSINVKKWGAWEKDYDTVAIKLSVANHKFVSVSGWFYADFMPIEIKKIDDIYIVTQHKGEYTLELQAEFFTFHNCSVYLNK